MKTGKGLIVIAVMAVASSAVCHASPTSSGATSDEVRPRTGVTAEQAIGAEQAIAAARAWLDDLKAKDKAKIAEKTRLPFTYATANQKKRCDGTAEDASKLAALVECLEKREKIFIDELSHAGKLRLKAIEGAKVPPSLAKLVGAPSAGERLVSTFIDGDGITFELVLSVVASEGKSSAAVRAVFLSSEVESG